MTKEQETIERLNRFKTIKVLYGNTFAMHTEQLKTLQEDLETVLNALKEKDEEIERIRYIENSFDYVVQKETEKKDKEIDLMAKYINYLSDELVQATGKNELEFCNGNKCCKDSDYSCEQCIKQYFERKSEEC